MSEDNNMVRDAAQKVEQAIEKVADKACARLESQRRTYLVLVGVGIACLVAGFVVRGCV